MVGPFSMFLSVPNHGGGGGGGSHDTMEMMYSSNYASSYSYSSAPSSSVDCTLSLGTPSTRLTQLDDHHHRRGGRRPAGSCVSNFCWDLLHPKQKSTTAARAGGVGGGNGNNAAAAGGGDPLLARRCANCDTTSTPLWRNGPKGPKSLCNACGIRFKKEERRAAATVNITAAEPNHHHHNMFGGNYTNSTSWIPHQHSAAATNQKLPCLSTAAISNESMFVGNDNVRRSEPENGISFLSWRLNVTDHRPSLVHDFTRS